MSSPLLSTKLYIPKPPPSLVPRPRLVEKLNAAINQGCGLIVLSAPAGSGKTTLLSEWIDSRISDKYTHFGWVSLDEGENDSVRFLSYIIAAIRTAIPKFGETIQAGLQAPQPTQVEDLVTEMINELSGLPNPLILVLDDYHLIHAQKVHTALAFILEHRSRQLHLVIAARADPSLPVSLLRSRGLMSEIRLGDLRFTNTEAASLMSLLLDHPLPEEDIRALTSRTEGWAAGLQMAATSMRESEDISGFIQAFSGSNRFILDYLVEQVLQQQPHFIREFLYKTSILDRLCAPLCEALFDSQISAEDFDLITNQNDPGVGHPSTQAILEYLERSNLFIVPLDDRRCWYRYHHLFTHLLGQRLLQLHPENIPELHRRASLWFAEGGFMAEAINHALAGQDFDAAANIIEKEAENLLMRSEVATFLAWMEKLPESQVTARPLLCINHAWAMLLNGYPTEMIEARLEPFDNPPDLINGKTLPLRAYIAIYRGQNHHAIELAKQALSRLPEQDTYFRSLSAMVLGAALISEGDEQAGEQAMEMASRISRRVGNVMIQVFILVYLAELCRKRGQLHNAFAWYQQALERATPVDGQKLPVAGRALMGIGEIFREWNDPRAEIFLREGIKLSGQWGSVSALSGYFSLASLYLAQKDWVKADEMIHKARQLAINSDITEIDDLMVDIFQAWIWIEQGNVSSARQWARNERLYERVDIAEMERKDDFLAYHMRKYEYPMAVRLWLAEGRFSEAQSFLEDLLIKLEKWKRPILVIETHTLLALALQIQGKIDQAVFHLESALALAEPEGFMRIFLNEGEALHSLLKLTVVKLEAKPLKLYGQRLLEAFSSKLEQPPGQNISQKAMPLIDPLSERELEVLRFLASSLSTPEIAAEMVISVHTARSHIKNIYAKLDAHNRFGAVERGKELGIL